jgi:hypothetical protein
MSIKKWSFAGLRVMMATWQFPTLGTEEVLGLPETFFHPLLGSNLRW